METKIEIGIWRIRRYEERKNMNADFRIDGKVIETKRLILRSFKQTDLEDFYEYASVEGVFVSDEMQSCGIGKLLLDYIKDKKVSLRLNVYQKNVRAISFYQREGFIIQCEDLDEATGEKEYTMLWKRK